MSIVDCRKKRVPDTTFFLREVKIDDVGRAAPNDDSPVRVVLDSRDEFTLPSNTPATYVSQIRAHTHKPVFMLCDIESGSVHALLLGQCVMMIFTPMLWWQTTTDVVEGLLGDARPAPRAPDVFICRALLDKSNRLRCAMVNAQGLDEDDVLVLDDVSAATVQAHVENGRLLVPHNIAFAQRMTLHECLHQEEVGVIYDQYGRLYYVLVNSSIHMFLMPLWTQMALLESMLKITGVTRATEEGELDTLETPYHIGDLLFMPRLPPEFAAWTPSEAEDEYKVRYTSDNRVMFITRECDGTDIDLSGLWDTRYILPKKGPVCHDMDEF